MFERVHSYVKRPFSPLLELAYFGKISHWRMALWLCGKPTAI